LSPVVPRLRLRLILTGLFLLPGLGSTRLTAQDPQPVITQIVIEGNQVTRDHIILRELSHPVGQPYDQELASHDRNQLYNLGIFESVEIYPGPVSDGEAVLVVEVVETVRMIPMPIFYYLDDVGWSYGGGVMANNFRGLNERLLLMKTFGGENTYTVLFSDPWIFRGRIGLNGLAQQVFRRHPVYHFRSMIRRAEAGLSKTARDKRWKADGALALEQRRLDWRDESGPTPGNGLRENLSHRTLQARVGFLWQTMDIWRDPTKGWWLSAGLRGAYPLDDESPAYTRTTARGTAYWPLTRGRKPLVLMTAFALAHYDRATPVYLWEYLGNAWVRGYQVAPLDNPAPVRALLETINVATTRLELQKPLIPRQLWQGIELGVSGALFADVGWGYGPARPLRSAKPVYGYGAVFRIFLPAVNVMMLELGANPYVHKPVFRLRIIPNF